MFICLYVYLYALNNIKSPIFLILFILLFSGEYKNLLNFNLNTQRN